MALRTALFAALLSTAAAKSTSKLMRGWSSWSLSAVTDSQTYGREWLTANNVLAQSAALEASGLQQENFLYINIDSFWAADPTQVVDAFGRWTPNVTRFPDGVRPIADAIHARGQKLGIYLNPGVAVAAVKQASPVMGGAGGCTAADIAWGGLANATGGNQFWDAYRMNFSHPCTVTYVQSFANLLALDWQVDFLKMDAVSPGSDKDTPIPYDNRQDIALWSAAFEATGRDVWLTISWAIDPNYAADFVPNSNAWRVADDVDCYCNTLVAWFSVLRIFSLVRPWLTDTGYGNSAVGRPDPDSLNVGQGSLDGLTIDEKLSYATLWAIIGAPLYTGNDLTVLDSYGRWLLGNRAVLAINEDAVTAFPTPASNATDGPQVWAIDYSNGTFVVALFNLANVSTPVTATFSDFAGARSSASFSLQDKWYGNTLGSATGSYTTPPLAPHGVQLIRMDQIADVSVSGIGSR